ncbi:MAG: post-transcriptional regulator [Bacilli bacterium]|nr:post-transcriptional regulator [Bacilli bacterium]
MHEYKSQLELYQNLIPALNVKLRLLKNSNYPNITKQDIWNYLKNNKWTNSINLTISEMVNDIIHADNKEIDIYINKTKL